MTTASTLPAFRVTYTDGTSYVTSTAQGVTLAEFSAYLKSAPHVREVYDHVKRDFVEVKKFVAEVAQIK